MKWFSIVISLACLLQPAQVLADSGPQVASLDQALQAMLPQDWTIEYAPSVNRESLVSYRLHDDFRRSLYTVRGGDGYRFFILSPQNSVMVFPRLSEDLDYGQ